jgi:hypothetical protein
MMAHELDLLELATAWRSEGRRGALEMDLLEAACAEDFRDMLLAHIGFDAFREPWVYIKRYFVANHASSFRSVAGRTPILSLSEPRKLSGSPRCPQ